MSWLHISHFWLLHINYHKWQAALAWYRRGSPHKCIRCWLTKDKDRKVSKSVHFCVSEQRVCIHQVRRLPIITAKAVMVLPCIAAILSLLLYHYECVDVFVCVCLTMLCLARVWSFQNSHLPLGDTWHNQAHLFVMCWSTCHYLYWERSFSLRLSVELTMLLKPAPVCNSAACVPLRLFTCPSLLWRSYPAERNLCESEGWRKICSSSRAIGAQTSLMDFPLQRTL